MANETIENVPKPKALLGVRHLQYLLMFSGAVVVYGMRTVLNVAIVAMLDEKDIKNDYPVYPQWKDHKNVMLSCFSWGHIWFQILAGQVAKNYGPKYYLAAAIAISSACILVIPSLAASVGYNGIIAVRVIEGAFHGVLFPSVHFLLSKWAPVWERAKWGSFVYAGQVLGNCLAMPITGVFCDTRRGWPSAFYFYGGLGMAWSLLWLLLGSNTPASDKRISLEERSWIESGTVIAKNEKPATPWKSIFTSVPFMAIIVTHCGQNWGFWTLLTEIPSFMKQVLHYNNTATGFISALPYLVMWLMNLWCSPIADYIIRKRYVSLVNSRKIFNSIGLFVPAIALVSITFIGSAKKDVIITILVITVAFNAGHYCGFNINHMDISPTFAGTLMGITNSISAIFTMMAPLAVDLVEHITGYKESDKRLWNIIFSISAGFYVVAGMVFIIFGSGEIQQWDASQKQTTNRIDSKDERNNADDCQSNKSVR